jgi:hypothetical protein
MFPGSSMPLPVISKQAATPISIGINHPSSVRDIRPEWRTTQPNVAYERA